MGIQAQALRVASLVHVASLVLAMGRFAALAARGCCPLPASSAVKEAGSLAPTVGRAVLSSQRAESAMVNDRVLVSRITVPDNLSIRGSGTGCGTD